MNPQIKENAKLLPRNYTSWVVAIVTALAAWWLQLAPEAQARYLEGYPWLKEVAPLAAIVSFVIARVLPQGLPDPQADDVGQTGEQEPKE